MTFELLINLICLAVGGAATALLYRRAAKQGPEHLQALMDKVDAVATKCKL